MMDRNREARRGASMVASSNGLPRRRPRSNNSLRDSDEDGALELQESVRLRERMKKDRERDRDRDRDRDRERERDRERDRERERERERSSRSSRRRRGERMMIHGSNRDDGGEDSSEESVNDDEDEDEEDNNTTTANNGHHSGGGVGGGGGVRLLQPNPAGASVAINSVSNHYQSSNNNSHHHNHHHTNTNNSNNNINHNHQQQPHPNLQHRKSYPPNSAKVFRAAPVWKSGDEMIGVPVPRKARSASIKRSHDWVSNSTGGGNSGGGGASVGGAEQIQQQAQTSPVRQSLISTSTPSPAAPVSPSSSNVSVRKKIKPNGPKQPRPPKSASSKACSSNPEELEIEIAEVLYGLMTQSQAPPKKEISSNDLREANRSSTDAKSRVSSPISNSPSANIQSSPAILPPNSVSSAGPLSAVAPKRKRPRQVSENTGSYSVRSSPISSTTAKFEADQTPKADISSPILEKNPGSTAESGYDLSNLMSTSQSAAAAEISPQEPMKVESELKAVGEELGESRDVVPKEEVVSSPKKESSAIKAEETNREDVATGSSLASVTKSSLTVPEVSNQREEKFQIDLEAPPPQLRLSPEREGEICLGGATMNHKSIVAVPEADTDAEMKPVVGKDKPDEKMVKIGKENGTNVGGDEKKVKSSIEDLEPLKRAEIKGRIIDLQLDLEKPERENGFVNKVQQSAQKQQQTPLKSSKEEPHTEKTGQPNSLPLPMSMASWPGGLPPMGYMAPLQGVVSMDGSTVSQTPIQPFFSQPRPKRCATHCYIARNINYIQQIMKNPFWSAAAAGSASLFGSKACNLGVVPPADLLGNVAGRSVSNAQDKGQGLAIFPGHGGKDKVSQPANIADANQRKQQILLQPALPPVAPNNILHAPAFIFPLNHQQAAAASARPASAKPPPTTSGNVVSGSATNSATVGASATTGGGAPAMSFNYPNIPTNETPYLAILQNNAYFPLPAVGAPSNFRGTHPQAMPLFNGSFYSSQIIHPSQLQQPQPPPPVSQSQQMQQSNQNASLSSGSSSSQKHLPSHQQRPTGNAVGGPTATGNLHNFPAPKNRPSQQQQNQHISLPQSRQLENEVANEDSPSTADSRGARAPVNIYGQNFAMPIHPQNYALLAPPAAVASTTASSGNSNQSDKKQQQSRQLGLKNVVEPLPAQAFAMSFAPINGATDFSAMAQNHAILQSLPEATRQNIQMLAANAAQQRKNFRISEDGKTGGDSSNTDEERKGLAAKASANVGQSIAFSRSELTDASGAASAANSVIDSSARPLNLSSSSARSSRAAMPNAAGVVAVPSSQLQAQHQPQQIMQHHKHQQQYASAAPAAWSKNPSVPNGSVYPEHLSSSPVTAKFPNTHTAFPQNLVQNNSSPTQSPQWKNPTRTAPPQVSSSFASSSASSLKTLPQQQGRNQQSHSQISFGANQKSSAAPPGQQPPNTNQSPASPMMVGSPSTSSISKGAGGSPRTTTSASASGKTGQASSLSGQQAKNSPIPGQKSSPVGGRNAPSILGNSHIALTSSGGPKTQMQQLQQQQQLTKNMQQQAQLYYSNPYMQAQPPISTTTNSTASASSGGYYVQRRRSDQPQQPQLQQQPGSSATSTGMLALSVSLAGASTTDPAKAIAAATAAASNMKGGGLTFTQFAAQSSGNQHQLMPAGYYVHAVPSVPAGVPVKPTEQKQPAGNDNLHACWQPEKK